MIVDLTGNRSSCCHPSHLDRRKVCPTKTCIHGARCLSVRAIPSRLGFNGKIRQVNHLTDFLASLHQSAVNLLSSNSGIGFAPMISNTKTLVNRNSTRLSILVAVRATSNESTVEFWFESRHPDPLLYTLKCGARRDASISCFVQQRTC